MYKRTLGVDTGTFWENKIKYKKKKKKLVVKAWLELAITGFQVWCPKPLGDAPALQVNNSD